MKQERLQQLMENGLPEHMARVCDAVVETVKRAGVDGIDMPTLWKKHAPEKSRAWLRDVLTVLKHRGQISLAFCSSHYLWCAPEYLAHVQADLDFRYAASTHARRVAMLARQEASVLPKAPALDDEYDSWPVEQTLVPATERRLPRKLPVRSVFELGAAA